MEEQAALLETLQAWAKVVCCRSLAEGLSQLAEPSFDALLLDLMLPDARRLEGLERIQDAEHDLAVIVLTTDDGPLALKALAMGAQDYLTKGDLEPRLLSRSVHYAIERHALRRAANEGLVDRLSLESALERLSRTTHEAVVLLDSETHQVLHASQEVGHLIGAPPSDIVGSAPFEHDEQPYSMLTVRGGDGPVTVSVNGVSKVLRARSFSTRWGGRRVHALALSPMVAVESASRAHPEQRHHGDHLVALGQLTTEIARDLRAPSTALLASLTELEAALRGEADRARLGELTEESLERARKIAALLENLHSVASAPATPAAAVRLDEVARAALELLEPRVGGAGITLVRELDDPPPVRAVEGQLVQIVTNLLRNALDAVGDRGTILVRTRVAEGLSQIEVHDDGPGLSGAAPKHAFDPYFTTKAAKQNMGLGLTIAADLALRNGGSVLLGRGLNGGCVARLSLPRFSRSAWRRQSGLQLKHARARKRVLLIDDERLVRRAYERVLSSHCDLITAESGAAALHLLETDRRFDHLLCDVEMPDMNGIEFLEALGEKAPELAGRVTLCTGGLRPAGLPPTVRTLSKPIELSTLLELLEVDDSAESSGS